MPVFQRTTNRKSCLHAQGTGTFTYRLVLLKTSGKLDFPLHRHASKEVILKKKRILRPVHGEDSLLMLYSPQKETNKKNKWSMVCAALIKMFSFALKRILCLDKDRNCKCLYIAEYGCNMINKNKHCVTANHQRVLELFEPHSTGPIR